jgi:hypothetical protein
MNDGTVIIWPGWEIANYNSFELLVFFFVLGVVMLPLLCVCFGVLWRCFVEFNNLLSCE